MHYADRQCLVRYDQKRYARSAPPLQKLGAISSPRCLLKMTANTRPRRKWFNDRASAIEGECPQAPTITYLTLFVFSKWMNSRRSLDNGRIWVLGHNQVKQQL